MRNGMNTYIDAQNVKNTTIGKLTLEEVSTLGLLNCGICTYLGELKTRYNGMKRIDKCNGTHVEYWFEGTKERAEFVELESDDTVRHWAGRLYNKVEERYVTAYSLGIYGCNFFRDR